MENDVRKLYAYLIQRGKFINNESKNGIDKIIYYDYMGSAEFEWGALPKSLNRIRQDIDNYIYLDIPIKDKVISVFCKYSLKNDIEQYLIALSENRWILKEFSAFDSYINNDGYFKDKFDFWWDIGNDIMFWRSNNKFEEKFKSLINYNPE